MKHNFLKVLPFLLLGGVLGLTAAPAAFQSIGVKAEDAETKQVKFTSSKIKTVIASSYNSTSKTFTLDGINFGDTNICYQGSSGSEYIQIKAGTSNGFWSTSSFEDFYISSISMTVANNSCALGLSSTSTFSGLTTVSTGAYSQSYTAIQGYKYFKIMSGGSATQIKNLTVTFTKNSGEPLPPFEGDYKLVESVSELKSGDKIVLGNVAKGTVAGVFGANQFFSSTQGTFGNGELTPTSPDIITLLETDGGWYLYTEAEDYIGCKESGKLASAVQDKWTISIAEGGAATIDNGTYKIEYNVSFPRFSCYSGEPTDTMLLPEIYKSKTGEADKFTITYDGNGAEGSTTDENQYIVGSTVTLLENGFTAPTGKEFKEWNTQADGNGTSYAPGATFSIVKNTTVYAIWKHKIDPTGDYYRRVTSISDLSVGAQVVFVNQSGDTVKVSGGLGSNTSNSQYYFTTVEAEISDDILLFDNGVEPYPFTLGTDSGYWTLTCAKGLLQANANTYFVFKNGESKWNINVTSSSTTVTSLDATAGRIQYNSSGSGRFSYYTSNQGAIQLFAKSGTIAKVNVDAEKEIFVNQTASLTATLEGATPTAYSWSILEGDSNVQLVTGQNTNTVQIKGLAEGTATVQIKCNNDDSLVATCVVTVKPASASILPEGDYFVINGAHTMHADISDSNIIDLSDVANMWTFEYASEGENTYYIKSSGGYLNRKQSIGSGQNTELALSTEPIDYWTISGSATDGFEVKCSSSEKYTYLAPGDDGKWRAIANKTTLTISKGLEFVSISPKGTPDKTTYNVGDDFDPKGLSFEVVYQGDVKVPFEGTITWNKIAKGTEATGTTYFGGKTVTVTVGGLTITNFKPSEISLSGEYKTEFYIGETVKLDGAVVSVKYVDVDTSAEKTEEVDSSKYDFSPKTITDTTTSISVFLKEDSSISTSFNITKVAKTYYTTNYVKAGEKILIANMSYDAYGINGGEELEFSGSTPTHASYTYSPNGLEELLVVDTDYSVPTADGTTKCVALKNETTGKYLRYNGSKFAYNKDESSITCDYSGGLYDFSYFVNVNGHDMNLNLHDGYIDEDGSVIGFNGFDYVQTYVEGDYVTSQCILLNDGTGLLTYKTYLSKDDYSEVEYNVDLTWENNGSIVIHTPNGKEETITEDAAFVFQYVKTLEEWYIQPYKNLDLYLSYNPDGDGNFGFYGSLYEQVCVYRNNSIALPSAVTKINVDESSIKTEYNVGDKFSWTGLLVTASYSNGPSSNLPVGAYDITMPDMSTVGTKTITVSYGALDNVVTDKFTITVKNPEPVEPTVVGAELTQKPTKTIYNPNEPIDLSGIVITLKMSDKTEKVVDDTEINKYVKNITPETSGGIGSRTVRINLKGGGDLYVQYTITVVAAPVVLSSIELQPSKTEYWLNEEYKYEGKIKAIYSDGTYDFVEGTLFEGGDTSTVGNHVVTVSYTEGDKTVSAQYTITVKEKPYITSFEISGYQQFIKQGEAFTEGPDFKVTAHYNDGASVDGVPYSIDIGDFNSNVLGDYTITVSIPEFKGVQTYTVTVAKNPINEVALQYTSSKVDAAPGDKQEIIFKKPVIDGEIVTYDDFEYTSSNEDIAEVIFENGKPYILYKDFGHCTITVKAKIGDGIATYQVNVIKHVTDVVLDKESAEIYVGSTVKINAAVSPVDADDKSLTWSSSDNSIATVDANGVVTGIKEGTVTITATSNDKKTISDSCEITVKKIPVTGVELNKETLELYAGKTETLEATVSPDNATYKDVTWTSSDTSVAKVDQNGKVTAVAPGTAVITVATVDGHLTDTCTVTVNAINVESVSINETNVTLDVGGKFNLVATILPSDATYKDVTWSSSDTSIVTVDANGHIVGLKEGTATITVTTMDGGKTATCTVTVVNPVAVSGVSLNKTDVTLDINGGFDLIATVDPGNAKNKEVVWTTSDASIVTVDANGHIVGLKEGSVTITVATVDGGKTATCTVKVEDKARLEKEGLTIVIASGATIGTVGVGCGVGIPVGLHFRKRKHLK